MNDNIYVLVCDDCDGNDKSTVEYVMAGTKAECVEKMHEQYEGCLIEPAAWYTDDEDVQWSDYGTSDKSAFMGADTYKLGCDRHISWWLLDCGPKPDHGPMFVVVKGVSEDLGGITTRVVGSYTNMDLAQQVMLKEFGKELVDPSFYAGWDPEYCFVDEWRSSCSVETMDMVVQLDILCVVSYYNEVVGPIGEEFEYLG